MNLKISLDHQALQALFPEGSEARAELSRAVVANLLQKIAVKDVKFLDGHLRNKASIFVREELERQGLMTPGTGWGPAHVKLPDATARAIRAVIEEQFGALLSTTAKEFWDNKDGRLSASIDKAVSYHVKQDFKALAKEAVREVLASGLK